jgi:hypothetical protein
MPSELDLRNVRWPRDWQPEAIEALLPYVDSDHRVEILVGDPERSGSGTTIAGYVYLEEGEPMIIYELSGRPDVYPWQLLQGPVLRIELLRPRKPRVVLFAARGWERPNRRRG